jgi:hypothetical protein
LAGTPVPLRGTSAGEEGSLSASASVAVFSPVDAGVKRTETVQLCSKASERPAQALFVIVKFDAPAPSSEPPKMVSCWAPTLVTTTTDVGDGRLTV